MGQLIINKFSMPSSLQNQMQNTKIRCINHRRIWLHQSKAPSTCSFLSLISPYTGPNLTIYMMLYKYKACLHSLSFLIFIKSYKDIFQVGCQGLERLTIQSIVKYLVRDTTNRCMFSTFKSKVHFKIPCVVNLFFYIKKRWKLKLLYFIGRDAVDDL